MREEIDLFHKKQIIESKLSREVSVLKNLREEIKSELKSRSKNPIDKKEKTEKRLNLFGKLIEEKDPSKKGSLKNEIANTFNERKQLILDKFEDFINKESEVNKLGGELKKLESINNQQFSQIHVNI